MDKLQEIQKAAELIAEIFEGRPDCERQRVLGREVERILGPRKAGRPSRAPDPGEVLGMYAAFRAYRAKSTGLRGELTAYQRVADRFQVSERTVRRRLEKAALQKAMLS